MALKRSWTDEDLIRYVPIATCWSDLWKMLNLNPRSGNASPRKRVKELNLDFSHFDKNHWNRGKSIDKERTHKKCSSCGEEKEITNFHFKNKTKQSRNSNCIECQLKYGKKHYNDNKEVYIDQAKQWKLNEKIKFYNWLSLKSCEKCNEENIVLLEFHHPDDNKEFNISSKIGIMSFESLQDEINKCEIICVSCHRKVTANDFNWLKAKL